MNELMRRMVLTEKTKEKYFGREFAWGSSDCAKIAAFHARKFGWKVPKTSQYNTAFGAARCLKQMGCNTIEQLITKTGMKEITPAMAIVGDIVSFESDDTVGAVGIVVGNGNMLAFHEAVSGAAIISMNKIDKAWSIWNG